MLKQRSSASILNDDVILCGYFKKLKTMKKKFFVLYNETPCNVARIEYYDNEKKYKSGFTPKRVIKIKNCFNINRRLYTKHEFVIVLASKEGGFGIVMDTEDEMNAWLNHLLLLQRSGEICLDFPKFDYVWQVIIQKKGIAEHHDLFGNYHICLANKYVTFIKIGREKNLADKKNAKIEVLLTAIRTCGDSQCYFYMEIGRQSSFGPGELWMETEDSLTAKNMHKMILSKMISLNEVLVEPMRKRSSSATETSNIDYDRKSCNNVDTLSNNLLNADNICRERCDSLPSRNRTSSECSNHTSRIMPTILANRITNIHISNNSQIAYSASEDSTSVDDSEESIGMSHFIRSTDGVILEEYMSDAFNFGKVKETTDMNSLSVFSMCPGYKTQINITKRSEATNVSDMTRDICGNVDNKSYFSIRANSFGSKLDNDLTKEAIVNRVRAFSVGSRIKCNRISKVGPKFSNTENVTNDFGEYSTRKSVSVPVLINKNIQFAGQMSDLMEIDFSKSVDLKSKFDLKKNEYQLINHNSNICHSTESIVKSMKSVDNGYVEMKPITTASNNITCNSNNTVNTASLHMENFKQKDSTEHINKKNYSPKLAAKVLSRCSNNDCDKSFSDDIKEYKNAPSINQDLHYASLDLPKCGDEVNTRYNFKESTNDTSIDDIENEYAKINFDQTET